MFMFVNKTVPTIPALPITNEPESFSHLKANARSVIGLQKLNSKR